MKDIRLARSTSKSLHIYCHTTYFAHVIMLLTSNAWTIGIFEVMAIDRAMTVFSQRLIWCEFFYKLSFNDSYYV